MNIWTTFSVNLLEIKKKNLKLMFYLTFKAIGPKFLRNDHNL